MTKMEKKPGNQASSKREAGSGKDQPFIQCLTGGISFQWRLGKALINLSRNLRQFWNCKSTVLNNARTVWRWKEDIPLTQRRVSAKTPHRTRAVSVPGGSSRLPCTTHFTSQMFHNLRFHFHRHVATCCTNSRSSGPFHQQQQQQCSTPHR